MRTSSDNLKLTTIANTNYESTPMLFQDIEANIYQQGCQNSMDLQKSVDLAGSGSRFPDIFKCQIDQIKNNKKVLTPYGRCTGVDIFLIFFINPQ